MNPNDDQELPGAGEPPAPLQPYPTAYFAGSALRDLDRASVKHGGKVSRALLDALDLAAQDLDPQVARTAQQIILDGLLTYKKADK